MNGDLTGGCLCGAVRYTLRDGFRFRPYACHCSNCQTRTGAAFSEHMLFAKQDIDIEGDLDSGSHEQSSGALSTIWGCARRKVRIFAENDKRPGFASLRCGTLDRSHEIEPAAYLWVNSKQAWITLPDGVSALAEQPQTQAEWIALVGPAARYRSTFALSAHSRHSPSHHRRS